MGLLVSLVIVWVVASVPISLITGQLLAQLGRHYPPQDAAPVH